jgi:calcium-dependent protein kinase
MKYLHLQKICHRDLKAENFLFADKKTDRITLIDFGMAFLWHDDMRKELVKTGNNKLVGTSYYVAPEVIARDYDQRCDIWSLGVLLHVIVTASPPFPGDDDNEILQNIKNGIYV